MTINLGALTGNAYFNVFLSGLTEFPASIIIMFTMRIFGRKKAFLFFGVFFAFCNAIAVPFELIPGLYNRYCEASYLTITLFVSCLH